MLAVDPGTTSMLALFNWPTYESERFYSASNSFQGHEGDVFILFILAIVFPTVVTIFLTGALDQD
eukprot:CAMPEP_0119310566 /NCGR_PEP_ID=MMETSP1333-20130426/19646_1 /TAXON_ID=418940 /ORGANISM="Scyphosphaera apsteinii, Strain RCC1455" /LENGTH=64 /DNA_ID=CAMNT_0007314775 /DNA_START=231 /DNA_END=425 /DNA_ORIENTATION=+